MADLDYEADLLGNIQQALAGLQGFEVMALELIQNADDARASVLTFDVRGDALGVGNDARFSNCGLQAKRCPWEVGGDPDGQRRPCNFHAISRMGSRSKVHAGSQIGRFGIGFVSVYQITDSPVVRSGGIEMRLEPLNGKAPTRAIPETAGTEFELAWASASSQTRTALNASPTPVDVASLLVDAISGVMTRGLFFLRHLRELRLLRDGGLCRAVSIERDGDDVMLALEPQGSVELWKVLSRDARGLAEERTLYEDYPTLAGLGRSTSVQVAVPVDDGLRDGGLLFAYLPTEQPSGLPLHVNGDFFPHPNRRSIVLTGEQHERHWNELLLDTAAAAIADAFEGLRADLGGPRLWALGAAAFQMRQAKGFTAFWRLFADAARGTESVWTADRRWRRPASCHLPPEDMPASEQAALAKAGIDLIHPDLRPMWTVLSSAGATPLRLQTLVDQLGAGTPAFAISPNNPELDALWAAIGRLIETHRNGSGWTEAVTALKALPVLLDKRGAAAAARSLRRVIPPADPDEIGRYVPDCPLVHASLAKHEAIMDLVAPYRLGAFAADLKRLVPDQAAARSVIGDDPAAVRRFYATLTSFEFPGEADQARSALAMVPMLRSGDGFVSPARGRLPGGFVDPIGHFELVDTTPMDRHAEVFAREVLGVRTLSFGEYVDDHLEDILAEEPTRQQYRALVGEILGHRSELEDEGALAPLRARSFVRTRAGSYARPDECYYWSLALETLLGEAGTAWVDEAWMPDGRDGARFRDLLEGRLGMRTTVSMRHVAKRVEEVAENGTVDEVADRLSPVFRHVLERWTRLEQHERQELEGLRSVAFLPAEIAGERVPDMIYPPGLVYRAARASGFSSQAPVVDLIPLRQATQAVTELLDLLDMPAEPPTERIVAHLEHCMAVGSAPSDVVYAMLSERCEAPDSACIDKLMGTAFIFAQEQGFLSARRVFWTEQPFGGRWRVASSRMRLREKFYRRLGVSDAPGPADYAALLVEITGDAERSPEDVAIHGRCLAWLAEAFDGGTPGAGEAVGWLAGRQALLNLDRHPVRTADAVWVDSQGLVSPFGSALDRRLVAQPPVQRAAAERFFRWLRVRPATGIARLRLASPPDHRPAPDASDRLRDRADLLLWLAPNAPFRAGLREMLGKVEVRLSDTLLVQSEIVEFEPPVRSPVVAADAFFDEETGLLHVRAGGESSMDWTAAFRALFARLDRHAQGVDMPPVVMAAAFLASAATWEAAERALRQSDYAPPREDSEVAPGGTAIGDAPQDQEDPIGTCVDPEHVATPVEAAPDAILGRGAAGASATSPPPGSGGGFTAAGRIGVRSGGSAGPLEDAPFRSKADDGNFGGGQRRDTAPRSAAHGEDHGNGSRSAARSASSEGSETSELHVRRSRMRSYVAAAGPTDSGGRIGDDAQASLEIDEAAMAAALRYERERGWLPEAQHHNNPGFDIVSEPSTDGSGRRLIEVKGLRGDWTERGVRLSPVQFAMAQRHPGDFWIYVVENAPDLQRQKVTAIANPFSKVDEYWFDDQWRLVSEESAGAGRLNARVGARIRHGIWGVGTIVSVEKRGMAPFLTIDFGPIEGRRGVPFGAGLEFVD